LVAEAIKQPIKQLMAIPVVIQGTVEVEGKVFELDSPKGGAWLETIGSFRFEPTGDSKACTIRREPSGYWYGCRKVAGKVCKKYIGKTSEISTARLEEIAEALEVSPAARVSKVAEVTQQVAQNAEVAEVAQDRLTALELEVASLRKALEELQEALPGKLELGDSLELPKVDNEVTEGLQNELGNLKAENEALKTDIETLRQSLAKSDTLINLRNQEIAALTCRLAAKDETIAETGAEFDRLDQEVTQLRSQLEQERADREEVEAQLSSLKQESVAASELPEAADLLNQLKVKRKKSTATLGDVEKILEILEASSED
jgi:chromosome segregation ATPase